MSKPSLCFALSILLLFVGTLMPGSLKAEIESHFWSELPWSSLAHFAVFSTIAVLPVYGNGRAGFLRTVVLALLLAAATEFLQSLVPGRHPLLRDALIDLAGTTVGLTLRSLWLARTRQPQMA